MADSNPNFHPNQETDFSAIEFDHCSSKPMCSPKLISFLLSSEHESLESTLFLSWAIFYYYGLWNCGIRTLITNIGDKVVGYEKSVLPWHTEKEPARSHWYPDAVDCESKRTQLRQLYDHWFKKTILSKKFSVEKLADKGLYLITRHRGGIRMEDIFDSDNAGILISLSKKFFHKLTTEYMYDSIYEIRKEDPNNYRSYTKGFESYAVIGPQSIMNHDNNSQARLMHIEDNSRSLLIEFKFNHYEHKFPGSQDEFGTTLNSFSPLKAVQQALPDGKLTQEEINDGRDCCERYWFVQRSYRHINIDKYTMLVVTRATFIKDISQRLFQYNEELVIKYTDKYVMGRRPNTRLRDHQIVQVSGKRKTFPDNDETNNEDNN